VTLSET